MTEYIFRLYSFLHLSVKRILGRKVSSSLSLVAASGKYGIGKAPDCEWNKFIINSEIKCGSQFDGFHYAGYILEKKTWCLKSWVWTNSAIVRCYARYGNLSKAIEIAELLLNRQHVCGGWIVRNDYDEHGAIPMLAPNDSAYIANNAMLSIYRETGEKRFLDSACRCAEWIMATSRGDGMVYTGYNTRDGVWNKKSIIVDVGFTAGLFSELFEITGENIYKAFLAKFISRYIELFYRPDYRGFATSINQYDKPQGGLFARGQAWALEGLIPSFKILKENSVRNVIESTVEHLLLLQNKDGSWPYNLTRKLMGNDCKGVSVIAKSLLEWHSVTNDQRILIAAQRAIDWCCNHTIAAGEDEGGIFSFSTEGAIVKDLYTSCAFVYASAYAIEAYNMMNNASN